MLAKEAALSVIEMDVRRRMATVLDPKTTADDAGPGSERTFGLVFAALFFIIACRPLLHHEGPHWWAVGVAIVFAALALAAPAVLWPLNSLWHQLGLLLHRIMSPLVMGAIFFLAVTPIAVIMRLTGKDVLGLRRRSDLASYWIARESTGDPQDMKRQF
jgi:hypothetical protein